MGTSIYPLRWALLAHWHRLVSSKWNWNDRNLHKFTLFFFSLSWNFCSDDTRLDFHIGKSDIWGCKYNSAVCEHRRVCVRTGGAACNWFSHSTLLSTCRTIFSTHFEASLVTADYLYCRLCHCYEFVFIQIIYMAGKCLSECVGACVFLIINLVDGINSHFNCRF